MGLDMYLDVKHHVSKYQDIEKAIAVRKLFNIPPSGNLESVDVSFEVAYWRKANHIHKWFIDNCADGKDDCSAVFVSRDKLRELLGIVRQVLGSTELVPAKVVNGYSFGADGVRNAVLEDGHIMADASVAVDLLPCESGFFFGSTSYDQWYWSDLKYTEEVLAKVLKYEDCSFEYRASW